MNIESVEILITGQPVAKGRPRMTRSGIAFTPAKTRKWEADARILARQQMAARAPLTGPLVCEVEAVFPAPTSWPAWKRELALRGQIAHTTRPDADNLAKSAKDACNGIVWTDDAQVCALVARKRYGAKPGVSIIVRPIAMACSQTRTREEATVAAFSALAVPAEGKEKLQEVA